MKSLINENVEHIKFGQGLIVNEETGNITVEFQNQIGSKKFQFPDAFEQFLTFKTSSLQEESQSMIESKKQRLAEENERKRLEEVKLAEDQLQEELAQKKKYKRTAKIKTTTEVKKVVKKSARKDEYVEEFID